MRAYASFSTPSSPVGRHRMTAMRIRLDVYKRQVDGSIIEMATVGREGCTGVQAAFGAKSSPAELLVQIPGSAAKMSRAAFTRAMQSMPSFRSLMYLSLIHI